MGGDAAIISNIRDLLGQLEGSMGAAPMPMDMGMEPAMMEEEEAEEPVMEGEHEEEEDLDERRARGRDREGMAPDERRRPMSETVLRERIRTLLKNVKFKK